MTNSSRVGKRAALMSAVAGVVAVLLLVVLAQSGSARNNPNNPHAVYGNSGATISISQSSVTAGGQVEVTGTGFAPHAGVSLTLESRPVHIGRAHANRNGKFKSNVTIPSRTPAGVHNIVETGRARDGSMLTAKIGITVQAHHRRHNSHRGN
jgi:hypothetical protein